MKAAMVYWKSRGINEIADNPNELGDVAISDAVTKLVNSGMAGKTERSDNYTNLKSAL